MLFNSQIVISLILSLEISNGLINFKRNNDLHKSSSKELFIINKHEFILKSLFCSFIISYKSFIVSKIIFFLSLDKNSVFAKQKQILYSHKIALYKNDIISSIVVSCLHNNNVQANGVLLVKYLNH